MTLINRTFVSVVIIGALFTNMSAQAQSTTNPYAAQFQRAIRGVLANILANGATVASPSQVEPNYYFDWVRDTSLTMHTLIQLLDDNRVNPLIRSDIGAKISRWVDWELARQETPKLTDLGEPRFYVDGSSNREPWGRPQNDGPALRAITAISLAQKLIAAGRFDEVKAKLYKAELPAHTLIKRDLEYVAYHWTESSYDLWEEERAMHYYTLVAQMVALTKGANLAQKLGDPDASKFYGQQAVAIQNYLSAFFDPTRGIIKYAINKVAPLPHKHSDLDIAVILIAIQTFDGKFYVPVNEMVRTANAITAEFQKLYPINQTRHAQNGAPLGVAIGRYPDDKYSGFDFSDGNPWFLATLALGEFACDLHRSGFATRSAAKLREIAIAQFNRVLYHLNENGSMSEQFRRDNGFMQGARDLTWSYASYITAFRACF